MFTPLKFLVASVPQDGHLRPLLPLAGELSAAGHEVIIASGAGCAPLVRASGIEHRTVGPELGEWFGRLAARTLGRPGDGLRPDRVEAYFVPRLFGEVGLPAMVDDLEALVVDWRPDLVLYEPYCLAAPLVAAAHGVPAVEHGIGLPFGAEVARLVEDAVTPAWSRVGLPPPGPSPARLVLDVCPPSLAPPECPAREGSLALRPAPLPSAAATPLERPDPDRPLVYVTLGTFANADLDLFRLLLHALEPLPVSVLVTAGDEETASRLGAPPANAVIAGYLPQADVLPACAAVVHHAGAGTAFGVLAHGLPSLALPQSADNFRIARSLETAGAARVLMPEDVTAEAVRAALLDVLAEPSYRRSAEAVAREMTAMPGPTEIVPSLVNLARSTREEHR